jgi:GNAT superfamily N-acetyltransferase
MRAGASSGARRSARTVISPCCGNRMGCETRLVRMRRATQADVPAVEQIVRLAYGPYIDELGIRPRPLDDDYAEQVGRGLVFLGMDGDQVVGFIVLVDGADHLLVENVAVTPGRQGEGIGRTLLAFADDAARDAGYSTVKLYTHSRMARNRALYLRLGFEEVAGPPDDRSERVFFAKRLES